METSNILYQINLQEISSKNTTVLKDLEKNTIDVENFIISLKEMHSYLMKPTS